MNRAKHNRLTPIVSLCTAILILANGAGAVAAGIEVNNSPNSLDQGTATTYAGSASTLSISAPLTSLTFGAAGPLSPTGGWVNAPMSETQTSLVAAELLTSVAMGLAQQAESEAAVGSLVLLPGTAHNVTADFAMSRAFATCGSAWGDSQITNLQVAGTPVVVTGAANQVVDVAGVATLTINEQTPTSSGITVNALDLSAANGVQVLVDSAYSAISCPTPSGLGLSQPPAASIRFNPDSGVPIVPGSCPDFTTGGGWIPSASGGGAKANFGFVAGYKQGAVSPTGEVEYHDHAGGQVNMHSLDVLYYGCEPGSTSSSPTRGFGGDAEVNHVSGYCYEVVVQDNGEPGAGRDNFAIFISPPSFPCPPTGPNLESPPFYSNGNANGNNLGGGNIEIHQ
jgi:hypothetical protein